MVASAPAGKVNNVDLRADVLINGKKGVLVAATDRSEGLNGKLALYALESSPVGLRHLGHVRDRRRRGGQRLRLLACGGASPTR
ncbi:phytase [Caulobacter segnis]